MGFYGTISGEKKSALYCVNNMSLRSIVPYPEIGLRGGVLAFEHLPLHEIIQSARRRFFLRSSPSAPVRFWSACIKSPRILRSISAGNVLARVLQSFYQTLLAFVAQHDETNLNDNTLPSTQFLPGRRRV